MTPQEAAAALEDEDLIPVLTKSLAYCKQLRDRCLEAGVAVVLGDVPGTS